jgi:hypothetical protein
MTKKNGKKDWQKQQAISQKVLPNSINRLEKKRAQK